jgi:hypothetical protein
MNGLLQTVTAAVLAALVGGRVAITRTGRLRRTIQANVELLGTLPADHPSREDLATHIEDLVDTLVLREQGQFQPITWMWAAIFTYVAHIAIGVGGIVLMLMDPLTPGARLAGFSASVVILLGSTVSTVALVARWWRERDLEDDEEPDQDDDQRDDQTSLLTAS